MPKRPAPPFIREILTDASQRLGSRLEADLLLAHVLERDRSWLYAHDDQPLDDTSLELFEALLSAREAGEPVAYLLGRREFYSRDFLVNRNVLIPRPETELLIDLLLGLGLPEQARVCDVGTGSGCIALTLAAERPAWTVWGLDRSAAALAVAAANRCRLRLGRVKLLHSDLLGDLKHDNLDAIVSNPPYVAAGDAHLREGDVRFEPRRALIGGADGLTIIRRLIDQASEKLRGGGWLLLEHGHDQAERVRALLIQAGYTAVHSHSDLAGIVRVTQGRWPGEHPPAGI